MFSMCTLFKNTTFITFLSRHKSRVHWAKLKKKVGPTYKALNHFDDFYGSVFGNKWEPMRTALLRNSKYVALINNYGSPEETMEYFFNRGAHSMKTLMEVQQQYQDENPEIIRPSDNQDSELNYKLESLSEKIQSQEISNIYSQSDTKPEKLELSDVTLQSNIEKKLNTDPNEFEIDQSRIIDPSLGLTTETLWQYVPATKLKGMDDWIPESVHFSYYTKAKDFPMVVEPETEFTFPEHLKVLTYEMGSECSSFPEPRRCKTGVFNYYPMDGGSILPVLALCLSPGDRVLDMCSAPGGKALVALQTFLPDIIVCNDSSISRMNRLQRIFKDYLCDFEESNIWRERVSISKMDALNYEDNVGFDKVLVDVPCTTDRVSVREDDNNIFRPDRVKERLKIPEMQSQLLVKALQLVRPGGAVVYSTCTLSPIQNDGVVHMSLKQAFEMHGILATVRDMSACFACLSSTLRLGRDSAAPRYGQLVMPHVSANFGPTYFSRLVRTK